MDSKETKKWYYVLPVVSIGIFILAWVWLSSAENSMIPTPLATWEKFLNIMTNPISQRKLFILVTESCFFLQDRQKSRKNT